MADGGGALWLDADQVPVQNPEFLFDTPEFVATGAVFWPDYGRFPAEHPMWRLTGVPYRDEPEVQAGEILVDALRHLRSRESAAMLLKCRRTHSILRSLRDRKQAVRF